MVADLGTYVEDAAAQGLLVVQPRMGMPDPETMAAGIAAVAGLSHPTVATITVDSYTRVGDHQAAARAVRLGPCATIGKPFKSAPLAPMCRSRSGTAPPVQLRSCRR